MDVDEDKTDEAVLVLLWLTLHDGNRAWKGFDWDALDRLHGKGLIGNPANKAKSTVLTEEGCSAPRNSSIGSSCARHSLSGPRLSFRGRNRSWRSVRARLLRKSGFPCCE